jgi:hypothetical protein
LILTVRYKGIIAFIKEKMLHFENIFSQIGMIFYGYNEGRQPKAGRALTLERKLWGGFSKYALEGLELLKCNPGTEEPEKISAAWFLMVWYYTQQDYERALQNFNFACRLREKLINDKKWKIPAACCQVKLGQLKSARDILNGTLLTRQLFTLSAMPRKALPIAALFIKKFLYLIFGLIKKGGFNPDGCLCMANTLDPDAVPASFTDTDSFRLHWINRVFAKQGLAPIKKRNYCRSLALDNLTAPVQPRSTGLGQGKISVIMPSYNAASSIGLSIESILSQTWHDIELIVVDDCSTDDTFEIAQRYAAQDDRVTAVRQPNNMGAYTARNVGVRLCTGDFITVHDSDDWSHPQKLEVQIAPLFEDSRLLGTFSFWVKVDRDMNIVGGWRPWGKLIEFNESSFLFRRSLLDSLGEWDSVRVTGDREFIWRAEAKYGEEAFAKVCKDAPLSFSLASQTSLTQAQNTHVKTVFYGLRRTYREAARWWHTKEKEKLYLNNGEHRQRRPFPVPDAILGVSSSKPVSHVIVSDFSRQALEENSGHIDVLEAVSRTAQTALFHWPSYFLDGDDTLDDRVFEAVYNNDIRLLVPGETIYPENVVILKTKPLGWLPDSFPAVRCRSVFILEDGDDKEGQDVSMGEEIRINIESVFGHPPVNVSFATLQDITFNKDCDPTLPELPGPLPQFG